MVKENMNMDFVDPKLLIDMIMSACGDKSKKVRSAIAQLSPNILPILNKDLLKKRIRDKKPAMRDSIKTALKRAGFLKKMNTSGTEKEKEKKQVKKIKFDDYEKAMQIMDKSKKVKEPHIITSVLEFGEPTDHQIANIHSELSFMLNELNTSFFAELTLSWSSNLSEFV